MELERQKPWAMAYDPSLNKWESLPDPPSYPVKVNRIFSAAGEFPNPCFVVGSPGNAGSLELDGTTTLKGKNILNLLNVPPFSIGLSLLILQSKKLLDSSRNPFEGTTDFEEQLQELFDEVKTMIKMGNENDAIDLLQANYEAVKEQMDAGARGIEQAATLDVIALEYIAIGNLKMVGSLLDMVISSCNKYSTH
ncbi:hypothetical protein HYC85_013473 [Camellia sinensis]|uniref:Uncharacterized protein n=1 Tax=Camellia sinensis TaxID=4442 RepID=A0A7J7H6X0_CAMSI|nr:hypothetical protein HYC85_013473 [Camellia sinensis]